MSTRASPKSSARCFCFCLPKPPLLHAVIEQPLRNMGSQLWLPEHAKMSVVDRGRGGGRGRELCISVQYVLIDLSSNIIMMVAGY